MADDYHRVFIKIDGEEKPVMMSTTDIKLGLQSMWLSDMDKGWSLLESRMPAIVLSSMKAYEAEKEETERKLKEKLGVTGGNPMKAFVARNWGWVAGIVTIVMVLRPDMAGAAVSFLF